MTEIIQGIRAVCGEDFVIQVLYSPIEGNLMDLGDDFLCTTIEEGVAFAQLFEEAGANSLHIRSSLFGNHAAGFMMDLLNVPVPGHSSFGTVVDFDRHLGGLWQGQWDGTIALLEVAAAVKRAVSIPVGVVGCADPRLAPDLVNDAVASGKIDFVPMTRPLMADPALPNKLKEGRRDEIAPCAHCLSCFEADSSGHCTIEMTGTATMSCSKEARDGAVALVLSELSAEAAAPRPKAREADGPRVGARAGLGPGPRDGRPPPLRGGRGRQGVLPRPALPPGSGAPTRTPTGSRAGTSPRGPTSPRSPTRKTLGWKTPAEAYAELLAEVS